MRINEGVPHVADNGSGLSILELKDLLDQGDLSGGGVHAGEGKDIVHHHARPNDIGTAVHSPGHKGYLEKGREFLLGLDTGTGVDKASLVAQSAETPNKNIVRNSLAEDLDLEGISDDFLSLPINVRVDEGNIVITHNDIS